MNKDVCVRELTAGEALLIRLKALGIDYLFVNSGTDFPPLIEGLARARRAGQPVPEPVIAPHENAAVGMAFGYYLATGQPQAVMVHTNVGLANAAIGVINAACDHIPLLLFSGRTPVTEQGRFGTRLNPINWGQEMRDQAALVRESVKWDAELRYPEQIIDLVDRAYAIAMSTPRGPVYISLPREPLCATFSAPASDPIPRLAAVTAAPDPAAVAQAAELLAHAERPVLIAQRGAGSAQGFATLARLAKNWALPVVEYWPVRNAMATDHPCYAGSDPTPWLTAADAVLVLDALTPWAPEIHRLPAACPVIHAGPNPLFSRFPLRGYRVDSALVGAVPVVLEALEAALKPHLPATRSQRSQRRQAIAVKNRAAHEARACQALQGQGAPLSKAYVAQCVGELLEQHDGVCVSELGCPLEFMTLTRHGAYVQEPHSGGLGWGLPTALGLQLAQRDRLIVATLGDGSYIFANPTACHLIAAAQHLPVLVIVLNNGGWNAVRKATLALYPDGEAARLNQMPLTVLAPSPDFVALAAAQQGWGKRVSHGAQLPQALIDAVAVVQQEKRLALLEVAIDSD